MRTNKKGADNAVAKPVFDYCSPHVPQVFKSNRRSELLVIHLHVYGYYDGRLMALMQVPLPEPPRPKPKPVAPTSRANGANVAQMMICSTSAGEFLKQGISTPITLRCHGSFAFAPNEADDSSSRGIKNALLLDSYVLSIEAIEDHFVALQLSLQRTSIEAIENLQ